MKSPCKVLKIICVNIRVGGGEDPPIYSLLERAVKLDGRTFFFLWLLEFLPLHKALLASTKVKGRVMEKTSKLNDARHFDFTFCYWSYKEKRVRFRNGFF